jgi:peroxiredoxin
MNVSISLHTQLEWTRPGNRARPQISPLIGEVAPAFSLPSLSGDLIQLSDFLGSPTLLLFWRPSCDFCQRMLEALRGWEDQPPANRPKLLVVSSESKQDNLALGLRSPIVLDEEGLPVSRLYGAVGTPMGVLIDEQGKIASEVMAGKRAVLALAGVRSELNFSLPSQRQQTQSEASGTDEAGHQARAPRPPKIFGIGLSRTGTTSLTEALTLLGYRTLHFPWDEVTRAELYQFLACHPASAQLSVLQVADAITDTPACCLYQA